MKGTQLNVSLLKEEETLSFHSIVCTRKEHLLATLEKKKKNKKKTKTTTLFLFGHKICNFSEFTEFTTCLTLQMTTTSATYNYSYLVSKYIISFS